MKLKLGTATLMALALTANQDSRSTETSNSGPTLATEGRVTPTSTQFQIRNTAATPIRGCIRLAGTAQPSGFYHVVMSGTVQVVYCENTISHGGRRGGWTLVWSHLRGPRADLTAGLTWDQVVTTPGRRQYISGGEPSPDLQLFESFVGIRWWKEIIERDPGGVGEIMYRWAADFNSTGAVDRTAICNFNIDEAANWALLINTSQCSAEPHNLPGLFSYHGGRALSTIDRENDTYGPAHCAAMYSGNPWWYGECWSGSIMGGGEREGHGYKDGAYWIDSDRHWGNPATARGAGNGWIFIR